MRRLEQENEQLRRERDEARARVAMAENMLRKGLEEAPDDDAIDDYCDDIVRFLDESPRQSLAEIEARALERVAQSLGTTDGYGDVYIEPIDLLSEATRICAEAKENDDG
jgi:hypothetical protein